MHVLYDGYPITPAANIDELMHTTSSDPPRYAILITQSGAQILILNSALFDSYYNPDKHVKGDSSSA